MREHSTLLSKAVGVNIIYIYIYIYASSKTLLSAGKAGDQRGGDGRVSKDSEETAKRKEKKASGVEADRATQTRRRRLFGMYGPIFK